MSLSNLWPYIGLPLNFALSLLNVPELWESFIVRCVGLYLVISLISLATIEFHASLTFWPFLLLCIIGIFFILLSFSGVFCHSQEMFERGALSLRELEQREKHDFTFIVLAPTLFITALFFPMLVTNFLTAGVMHIVVWFLALPVVGLLLKVVGILFAINMVMTGGMATLMALGKLYRKIFKIT